jgi:PHD/YefM family antitoxin component YafN of YafNO toxin-antitoxin module
MGLALNLAFAYFSSPSSPLFEAGSMKVPEEDCILLDKVAGKGPEVVDGLRQRGHPLAIMQNGEPVAVRLPPEEFDALTYHSRVIAAVQRGLADVEAGRVISDEDLERELDRRFGSLEPEEDSP